MAAGAGVRTSRRLAWEFVRRELRARYLGTFSGAAWVIVQPLLQLAIYGYVFLNIFSARLPEAEFGSIGFIAFLAAGLWPWNAFAESVARSATNITDNAGLLDKIVLPRQMLVLAPVCAGFLLHTLGFGVVLVVLWTLGWLEPRWAALLMPLLMLALMLFTLGLAWLFAALGVFVRDVAQILPQAILLLFFLTPVLYPRTLIPESLHGLADANPMALYVGLFRQCLLGVGDYGAASHLAAVAVAVMSAGVGYAVFRRLSPHFEDFL